MRKNEKIKWKKTEGGKRRKINACYMDQIHKEDNEMRDSSAKETEFERQGYHYQLLNISCFVEEFQ